MATDIISNWIRKAHNLSLVRKTGIHKTDNIISFAKSCLIGTRKAFNTNHFGATFLVNLKQSQVRELYSVECVQSPSHLQKLPYLNSKSTQRCPFWRQLSD